jgi:hypothetical protein
LLRELGSCGLCLRMLGPGRVALAFELLHARP